MLETEKSIWVAKIKSLEQQLADLKTQLEKPDLITSARPNLNSLVTFCKTLAPHECLLIVRDRADLAPYGEAIEIEAFNVVNHGCVELRVRPR